MFRSHRHKLPEEDWPDLRRNKYELKDLVRALQKNLKRPLEDRMPEEAIDNFLDSSPPIIEDFEDAEEVLQEWIKLFDHAFFCGRLESHVKKYYVVEKMPKRYKGSYAIWSNETQSIIMEYLSDGERFVGHLLHEMVHAFIYTYCCPCRQCQRGHHSPKDGVGKTGHGASWANCMHLVKHSMGEDVPWAKDFDVAMNVSIQYEHKKSGWIPREDQLERWDVHDPREHFDGKSMCTDYGFMDSLFRSGSDSSSNDTSSSDTESSSESGSDSASSSDSESGSHSGIDYSFMNDLFPRSDSESSSNSNSESGFDSDDENDRTSTGGRRRSSRKDRDTKGKAKTRARGRGHSKRRRGTYHEDKNHKGKKLESGRQKSRGRKGKPVDRTDKRGDSDKRRHRDKDRAKDKRGSEKDREHRGDRSRKEKDKSATPRDRHYHRESRSTLDDRQAEKKDKKSTSKDHKSDRERGERDEDKEKRKRRMRRRKQPLICSHM